MEFLIGCNYWASNAGTEMWREFDSEVIKKDIRLLAEHGVKHIRAFPNWRDFQPVIPLMAHSGEITGYAMDGGIEGNDYYIDELMLKRFSQFLDICEAYNVKVIVGLITGWMSGGLFIPPALYGKNIVCDYLAQYFQQLFIKGFVERFKDRDIIVAWDLGNECNCMATAENRWQTANWTATVANAIRAADPTKPIVSGMHGIGINTTWTIADQGMFCDLLTTHPYPYWCEHTKIDEALSLRTTLHPTAQTKYFSDIGKKPCFAEEIGTMGPMICSDEKAADFLRINMFSLWANGSCGVMWWCANDQGKLSTYPYTEQMVERELGMLDENMNAKPVLKEMKKFSELLDSLDFELPKAKNDACCILSRDQRQWGIAYMTYIFARKAGLNLSFTYADDEIPDSKLYILPSVNGAKVMHKKKYDELKKKVQNGAELYISVDNAVLSEFESLSGVKVIDSYEYPENCTAEVDGQEFKFKRVRNITVKATNAKVISYDSNKNPFITVNRYGKGKVYFVNAPIEDNLVDMHDAFSKNSDIVYKTVFAEHAKSYPVRVSDKDLLFTYHPIDEGAYVVILNHFNEEKSFTLECNCGYKVEKIYYGSCEKIGAYDACVIKVRK